MNPTETRSTRIAVFIDFDNVEIGVKSTIGGQFDIGLVLEAIKERGEIVTKIAYSDWKRAGDYSRVLTQHAIRMVQRNLTPGGDKNGADITMALDALEMAFTHDHINAFVIVGGDSDFISLVEKLKQYGRKVIVVGGRQFTSTTMQRNCHEFIAYENLAGRSGRPAERGRTGGTAPIAQALPLVRRALKVLSEREVTPQLGLLKSTLLQLDSTFSEREYGAGSFRDFMEKVAEAGAVTLKHAGRSMLVEAREDAGSGSGFPVPGSAEFRVQAPEFGVQGSPELAVPGSGDIVAPEDGRAASPDAAGLPVGDPDEDEETLPQSPMSMQDGIRAVQQAFTRSAAPPRWPMYVRQAKQFLRSSIDGFDERKYGFASVVDLLRAAAREGVVRIERNRQGAVRVFPGSSLESARAGGPTVYEGLPVVDEEDAEADAAYGAGPSDLPPAMVVQDADTVTIVEVEAVVADASIDADRPVALAAAAVDESDDADEDGHEDDVDEVDGNRLVPPAPKPRKRPAASGRAARAPRPRAKAIVASPARKRPGQGRRRG